MKAGAGGDEAKMRTDQLLNVYLSWGKAYNKDVEIIEKENGYALINIKNSYDFLKDETGAHRMLTWSAGRRNTTFTGIRVFKKVTIAPIIIKEDDLQWKFCRSGGNGGQNVNKVSTAVRLTHIPSGICIKAQDSRNQWQNRKSALNLLYSRLLSVQGKTPLPKWGDISFGNQIRSIWLSPEKRIKDLSGYESSNVDEYFTGGLNKLISYRFKKYVFERQVC